MEFAFPACRRSGSYPAAPKMYNRLKAFEVPERTRRRDLCLTMIALPCASVWRLRLVAPGFYHAGHATDTARHVSEFVEFRHELIDLSRGG